MPRTTIELQGMRWILQPPQAKNIRQPQTFRATTLLDGSISLQFSGYRSTGNPRLSSASDIESASTTNLDHEEFVAVSIWDATPWESDPEFDFEDLLNPTPEYDIEEEDSEDNEDYASFYLDLTGLELDYPQLSPTTVIPTEDLAPIFDTYDSEADEDPVNLTTLFTRDKELPESREILPNEVSILPNEVSTSHSNEEEVAHTPTSSLLS